jgi:hypothetical protein
VVQLQGIFILTSQNLNTFDYICFFNHQGQICTGNPTKMTSRMSFLKKAENYSAESSSLTSYKFSQDISDICYLIYPDLPLNCKKSSSLEINRHHFASLVFDHFNLEKNKHQFIQSSQFPLECGIQTEKKRMRFDS